MTILIYINSYLKKIKKNSYEKNELENTQLDNYINRYNITQNNVKEDLNQRRNIVNETYMKNNEFN